MLTGSPVITDVHVGSTAWTGAFYDYLQSQNLGDFGYRVPEGANQSKPLPWVNLNKVSITFSEDVVVQAPDLSLSGVNVPHVAFSDFFYDAYNHVATWTLAVSLPKNVYQIDLDGDGADPVADLAGNVLDGEWNNNVSTTSGNAIAGGDFQFVFKVLRGDVDQSGVVNSADYADENWRIPSTPGMAKYQARNDLDGNAAINSTDLQHVFSNWNSTLPIGSPTGVFNDAPTTRGFAPLDVDDAAIDVAISLYNAFDDAETADASLAYQIVSNSNSSLFDSVTISPQTGQLVMNTAAGASGRSTITVAAIDAAGQRIVTTLNVDVSYENQPPQFYFDAYTDGYNTWIIEGWVTDDEPLQGLFVVFEGAFQARASVKADGTFTFAVIVDPADWGWETGHVADTRGLESNYMDRYIGLS